MLVFRKILLYDITFYSLLMVVILITIPRLITPKYSSYSISSTSFTGTIIKIIKHDDYNTLYIKSTETIIGTIQGKNNFHLGETITINGEFQTIRKNTTPNTWNYQEYYYQRNIFYQVKIISYQLIKKNKSPYYYTKEKLYQHFRNNPYLLTFLLGDKTYINNDVKRSYQENGISHLFAISGMHITLLSTLLEKYLKKKKIKEKNRFYIISTILFFYLLIVGLSPSILRGVFFYYLFSWNKIYYFYIKPENLWIISISLALLINPYFVKDTGFLYSYSISYGLIKMRNQLTSNNYLLSLLKVSLLSFIVSIPISLYFFFQINLLSIIYNLVFVPLISIIVFPFSILVGLITPLLPIYAFLTKGIENLSLFLENIHIGILVFKKMNIIIYLSYSFLIILFLHNKNKKIIIILLLLLIIHKIIPNLDCTNWIEILDVDQGDSTILYLSNQTILLDTGGKRQNPNRITNNIIIPFLKSKGLNSIQTLIISHGDFDHMGEAINLVNNFKVEKVIFNCGPYNDLEKDLIKVLDKKKIKYYSCIKELNIDNDKLYFLQTNEYDNENDNSNVIYTELNGYRFMFMGDAGVDKEKDILDKYNINDIDVLKVGHHGSKTSSGKEFIDEIKPKYSIISVGKNNRYGHPNKEVLENLKISKIYRTDEDGSIMFKIRDNKLQVETCAP